MKKLIILLSLLCIVSFSYSQKQASTLIYITSQQGFDHLSEYIQNAVRQKSPKVDVVFEDGTYCFNDKNKVVVKDNASTSINLRAKHKGKVRIVSDGETYFVSQSVEQTGKLFKVRLRNPLDKYCTFQTAEGKALLLGDTGYLNDSLQTNISDAAIELVDSVKKVARIKLPPELGFLKNRKQEFFKRSQLCYKAQWSDCYRDILYSDSLYLYFTLNDWLMKEWNSYVANMYLWTKTNHRNPPYQPFFVTNIKGWGRDDAVFYDDKYLYVPKSVKQVHVCRYGEFMRLQNSRAEVIVSGFNFIGSRLAEYIESWGGRNFTTGYGLIKCLNSANLSLRQCIFSNMGGEVVTFSNAQNVKVSDCRFYDNYNDGMVETYGNNHLLAFTNNRINNPKKVLTHRMGISLNNTSGVLIAENEVANISRSFVIIGVSDSIIIRNNLLYTTPNVSRHPVRNFSSDTGALVYSWGNSPFTLQGNVVHDLPANLHYTGVMVDNGTGKAIIQGNLMFNIGDEAVYCWKNGGVSHSNAGNRLDSNILLGTVNYGGYDKKAADNAVFMDNVFVRSPRYQALQYSDATDKGGNVWADAFEIKDGKVYLSDTIYKKVMDDLRIDKWVKGFIFKRR